MRKYLVLGALLMGTALTALPVNAAPLAQSQMPGVTTGDGLLAQAQWWGGRRCGYWRRECAERFGWGNWRFRRCLWRHGCFGGGGRGDDDDHRGRGRDRDHDDDHGDRRGKGGGRGY